MFTDYQLLFIFVYELMIWLQPPKEGYEHIA